MSCCREASTSPLLLVVDDDGDARALTTAVLVRHGYRVVHACHGADALVQLGATPPDLVLLDLEMPVMDGQQFRCAQHALSDPSLAAIPVLLVTGAAQAADVAVRLAATGVVPKPVDLSQLVSAVEAALAVQ